MCSCKTENNWITSIEYDLDIGAVITIHCITVLSLKVKSIIGIYLVHVIPY